MKLPKKYHLTGLIFFIVVAIMLVIGISNNPLVFSLALIVTAIVKHSLIPIRYELLSYLLFAVLGTAAESLMMFAGAWQYTTPHLLNFPIWLPLLWGLAGIIGISLYQSLFATIKL